MRVYIKTVDKINSVIKALTMSMLLVCLLVGFAEVIARFFLHFSIGWANELCRFLLVFLTFMSAPLAVRSRNMISIRFLYDLSPKPLKYTLYMIVLMISLVAYGAIGVATWMMMKNIAGVQKSAAMLIPMEYMYSIILIGMILLILESIAVLFEDYIQSKNPQEAIQNVEGRSEAV